MAPDIGLVCRVALKRELDPGVITFDSAESAGDKEVSAAGTEFDCRDAFHKARPKVITWSAAIDSSISGSRH